MSFSFVVCLFGYRNKKNKNLKIKKASHPPSDLRLVFCMNALAFCSIGMRTPTLFAAEQSVSV
jgi:hypothetical protein